MNTFDIHKLLEKYLHGTSTQEENAMLESWYMHYENKSLAEVSDEARIQQLERVKLHLMQHSVPAKATKLWPRIAGIAAAVIGIAVCIYLFNTRHPDASLSSRANAKDLNDIAPGGNRATMTLANGEMINLSDNKTGVVVGDALTYNDNTFVIQSDSLSSRANAKDLDPSGVGMTNRLGDDKGNKMTVQTPRGGMYSIILQDGTKVWLNSDSKLEFFSNYRNRTQRIVKLIKGEAYLEVTKDAKRPFIVESKGQRITVLGTHFNVSAYTDDVAVRTTLLEGAVQINAEGKAVTLKPGQQAVTTARNIAVQKANLEEAVAWKNGYFRFNNDKIEPIMKRLARWYDIEVSYEGKMPDDGFNGTISRYKNISQVLKALQSTKLVNFRIEGRKVTVTN